MGITGPRDYLDWDQCHLDCLSGVSGLTLGRSVRRIFHGEAVLYLASVCFVACRVLQ